MSSDREWLRDKFRGLKQLRQDVRYTETWRGTTGRYDDDPTPQDSLPSTMIWVRPIGGRGAVAVKNVVVQNATGIPVEVSIAIDTEDQMVTDLDMPEALQRFGAAAVLLYAHGGRLFEAHQFRPGLVLPHSELGGLYLRVEGFWHAGQWVETQPLLVTPTPTSDKKSWVVVSHEAGATDLTVDLSAAVDTPTIAELEAVIQTDLTRRWLAYGLVANGDTVLNPAMWKDLRFFNEPRTGGGSVILSYTSATDLANAQALTASTWADIGTNQSFTKAGAGDILVSVSGCIIVGTTAAALGARIVIDSAGTPVNKWISGGRTPTSNYDNALSGSASVQISGLSAGSHTIKVQVVSSSNNSAYCRPSTQPNFEGLLITIVEL